MRSIVTLHHTLSWRQHFSRLDSRARCRLPKSAIGSAHWSKYILLKWSIRERMVYSFDRALMAPRGRPGIRLALVAVFALTIGWQGRARADDVLDRSISFHIAPSPLSSALIEFSTQSELQVAAADADVSHLNSNGVNGTLPARIALDRLLQGTGLRFSRVGATTIAIATAPAATTAASTRIDGSGAAVRTPAQSSPPNPNATANPSEIPNVTVTAARPPTVEELAGDSLSQFVVHHATVRYFNTGVTGSLARWRGGKQSICPVTDGLSPTQNAYVTARVRALATYVGAPVDSESQCKDNVQILFTNHPQETMDAVIKWATVYFRNRYTGGMKNLIAFRGDHAIQGWYMTTRGGAIVLNTDVALVRAQRSASLASDHPELPRKRQLRNAFGRW